MVSWHRKNLQLIPPSFQSKGVNLPSVARTVVASPAPDNVIMWLGKARPEDIGYVIVGLGLYWEDNY